MRPKLLYIGTFRGVWVSDYYRLDGFRKEFDTYIIDYRERNGTSFGEAFATAIREFKPDIIFINKGESIDVNVVKSFLRTASKKIYVVVFNGDQRGHIQNYLEKYNFVDDLLINNADKYQWDRYRDIGFKGIKEYHTATDLNVYKKQNVDEIYDVVFVGGYYGNKFDLSEFRMNCVIKIKSLGYKIAVAGSKNIGDIATKYRIPYLGLKYGRNFARFVSSSKVILSISAFSNIKHYTSNRTFNSMACGTCLCHRYVGCDDMFSDMNDIVFFDDLNDIKDKIDFAIKNRKAIHNQSVMTIRNSHTYDVRAKELMEFFIDWRNNG